MFVQFFVLKCDFWLWNGIQPHVHTAGGMHLSVNIVDCGKGDTLTATPSGGGKECTLTYTLLTVERDTASRPHCWWWKGMHPHVYTVDCGKGETLTATPSCGGGRNAPLRLHCWLWKGIQPHVHTAGGGKECTLTFTLLSVEREKPSRPHPLVVERNAPSRLHCWLWKGSHPHGHTF